MVSTIMLCLSRQQYGEQSTNRRGYCPNHSTGVTLPADFAVTPLQYVDYHGSVRPRPRDGLLPPVR